MLTKRICIYPKDVEVLTGKSAAYCRRIIRDIKKEYKKEKYQLVSISEFCEFMKLDVDEVKASLN